MLSKTTRVCLAAGVAGTITLLALRRRRKPRDPPLAPIVIFDLDGTLLDTDANLTQAVLAGLRAVDVHPTADAVKASMNGGPLDEYFLRFAGVSAADAPARFEAFKAAFLAAPESQMGGPAFASVPDALDATRESAHRMAVATTKPSVIAVDDLKLVGLAQAFDHVQGTDYDKGMKPKPAPDVILAALEGVGGRGGESGRRPVVYVGDTQRDVRAARAAGAVPVSVCYQPGRRATVESWGADAIIGDMAELPSAIARLVR